MLPITSRDKEYSPGLGLVNRIRGWYRLIFSDSKSRNLFLFLMLNLSMAFVELVYGILTNSLGLISDSFHMFFDCTALLAGLVASLLARRTANDKYSYGYVRSEVLAGFVNGLFLVFVAFFIFSEAVERIFEPPHVEHERLLPVSIIGFLVNLVGIYAFADMHGHSHGGGGGHGHSHGGGGHGHSHGGHGHSHGVGLGNDNEGDHGHSHGGGDSQGHLFKGVFLHIMADTLGSVGVIISSLLVKYYGWMIADPVCSMIIACLVFMSTIPLLSGSSEILLQRQPRELDHALPGCYHRVSQLEGVYSVHEPHFWTLCSDVYVGGIKVEVSPKADTKYILSQTHNIFTAAGVRQLHVQIDQAAE